MAMLGCRLVGVNEPRGVDRKKLIVWVEIDRCMADAVSAVTGVRLGKRTLKYVDYGKVAATFLNTTSNKSVRIVALETSRQLANDRYPEIAEKRTRQFKTYSEARDEELFSVERVNVLLADTELPGSPRSRVICARCGEGINDGREVTSATGDMVCRPCEAGAYYTRG